MTDESHDGRDIEAPGFGRGGTVKGESAGPLRPDFPPIARDAAGVPAVVFRDELPEDDRPSSDAKTLEVVLLWREAVMSVGHYGEPRLVTAGEDVKNDFRVATEGLSAVRFPLLEADGGDFVLNWTDAMSLQVRNEEGEILDGEELVRRKQARSARNRALRARQYRIGLDERVALQMGDVTFVIQYVSPARMVQRGLLGTIDFYFTKVLSLSLLAHACVVAAMLLTPVTSVSLSEDPFASPDRFAKLILTPPEKPPRANATEQVEGSKGGGKRGGKEGKLGQPDKRKKDALASIEGTSRVDPDKREKDRQIALSSGIFSALEGGKGGAVRGVFGPGGLGTGINNALGGLRGTAMGNAGGAGGLGTRGAGPGGGGNSLGIGNLGAGSGRGTGGLGSVDLGGRGKSRYRIIPGRSVTKGCLSQKAVGRVLSRVHNQARYCYEKELNRNPSLSGKITTKFTIGPTGAVMAVRIAESTMESSAVEQCLIRVIERLRFPPCAGGGVAEVTYPWIFKAGGK